MLLIIATRAIGFLSHIVDVLDKFGLTGLE